MNSPDKIHIENPCRENWQKMTPDKDGRFCNSCEKVVIDFSKKSLNEIQDYLTSSSLHVCGRYSMRHTSAANRWETLLNNIESTLSKYRMQKLALFLVTIILFLSGCHRRLQGAYATFDNYRGGGGSSSEASKDSVKTGVKLIEKK